MNFFGIERLVNGLKLGAEKFGSKVAQKSVKKVELKNGLVPEKPEPYGVENEDSANLGFDSAEKTTTAEREEVENALTPDAARQILRDLQVGMPDDGGYIKPDLLSDAEYAQYKEAMLTLGMRPKQRSNDVKKDDIVKENAGPETCAKCGKVCEATPEERDGKFYHEQCLPDEKQNEGHLTPEAWQAAATEERAVWLELAQSDINLATKNWVDLSEDLHVALQDAYDLPKSVNNAAQPKCVCGHPKDSHHYQGACTSCSSCSGFTIETRNDSGECKSCGTDLEAGSGEHGLCESCSATHDNASPAKCPDCDHFVDSHSTGEGNYKGCTQSGCSCTKLRSELKNDSGLQKKFTFRDSNGEEETVEASSEGVAWEKIAKDFATPVSEVKQMLKLVRENAKMKFATPCTCGHFEDFHQPECSECECKKYAAKTKENGDTKLCRCGDTQYQHSQAATNGWSKGQCMNLDCTCGQYIPAEKQNTTNPDEQKRILEEIKKSEAALEKLRALPKSDENDKSIKAEETVLAGLRRNLTNENAISNCAGQCGCSEESHKPNAARPCPCTCAECGEKKKEYQNSSDCETCGHSLRSHNAAGCKECTKEGKECKMGLDEGYDLNQNSTTIEMSNSGLDRGSSKYGARKNAEGDSFKPGDSIEVRLSDGTYKGKVLRMISSDVVEVEYTAMDTGVIRKDRYYTSQVHKI